MWRLKCRLAHGGRSRCEAAVTKGGDGDGMVVVGGREYGVCVCEFKIQHGHMVSEFQWTSTNCGS
jgi:hypothetical protein